jgi:hypothetical protein
MTPRLPSPWPASVRPDDPGADPAPHREPGVRWVLALIAALQILLVMIAIAVMR